jgi:hypothetical protein
MRIRQWYRFTVGGITYEVYASNPNIARENWLIWMRGIGSYNSFVDLPEWLRVVEFSE